MKSPKPTNGIRKTQDTRHLERKTAACIAITTATSGGNSNPPVKCPTSFHSARGRKPQIDIRLRLSGPAMRPGTQQREVKTAALIAKGRIEGCFRKEDGSEAEILMIQKG
ncbi:hypothetical protein [Haloferula sp. BvORR071]|uniref:hypothetical protein n=1 Tax=Haloferula sp. BvORR071 TaxID=1396141 RepID=UPI002240F75B|nr:hypothetical protein [Haloferula sp. BvORR071]